MTWEYMVMTGPNPSSLHAAGANGWEMVSAVSQVASGSSPVDRGVLQAPPRHHPFQPLGHWKGERMSEQTWGCDMAPCRCGGDPDCLWYFTLKAPTQDATPPDRTPSRVAGAGSRATKANSCGHISLPPAGGRE